jgi:leader peptidase (prepilin peptidase)/N-methyltransferase
LDHLPPAFWIFVFTIYGLMTGSLAGALSYRLPRRQPVVFDRSRCPNCGATLTARDLIPVFAWLISKGRCRHCHTPISVRYLWIELAVTALFLVAYLMAPNLWAAACLAFLGAGLVVLAVSDIEARILPDPMQLGLALLAFPWRFATDADWMGMAAGAVLGLGLGLGLRGLYFWLKKRHGLGMGDVKFLGMAGLWLGIDGLAPFLFVAGILGILFGLLWRVSTKSKVFPFGPALAAALFLTLVALPAIR